MREQCGHTAVFQVCVFVRQAGALVALGYLYIAVHLLLLLGITSTIIKYNWTRHGRETAARRLELANRVVQPLCC